LKRFRPCSCTCKIILTAITRLFRIVRFWNAA
jgi:hypothetical protein